MATSSIHKPGWRSRRRSRLSLVERAVPRLGDLSQLDYSSGATEAEDSLSSLTPAVDLLVAEPPVREAKALGAKKGVLTLTEPVPADDSEKDHAPSAEKPDRNDQKIGSKQSSAETIVESPPAENDVPLDAVTTDEVPAEGKKPVAPAGTTVSLAAVDPAIEPIGKEDTASLAAEPVAKKDTTSKADIKSQPSEKKEPKTVAPPDIAETLAAPALVPATEPDAEHELELKSVAATLELDDPEVVTSPVLELDWDSLTESGYIDPRDRGRSLPANMVPIIRALVRQALSDQSSWRDRIILVTSANERASKSAAAVNFAFGLTTVDGHHAVLLDADSTDIGAVDQLGGHERIGITNALADESLNLDDLVIRTDLDRLTLVASGSPDTELVDHLASRRMLQILRYLTEAPETILVIDAPPILISQEAAVLSVVAGQVVLAVEAGRTTADQIEHALQRIGDRHNVSLVLNESSGISRESARKPFNRRKLANGNRRTKPARGHLPKVAAAIGGAIALGLLFQQIQSITTSRDGTTKPDAEISVSGAFEVERWPGLTEMALAAWRKMYQ